MTETRKQIIDLIKDYMDKTLSEGCLIWYWENDIAEYWKLKISTYTKILWHYDITAVLKYVKENNWCVDIHWWINLYTIGEDYSDIRNFTELPYKPLHLYSEQQEKALIELLNKLNEK